MNSLAEITDVHGMDFDTIPVSSFWNTGNGAEQKMHRIHAYPAKFPSFITTKILDFARHENRSISSLMDCFCGCGTVAFEAKREGIDFFGCDINPVATMIAKAKSRKYCDKKLTQYYSNIVETYSRKERIYFPYVDASERIRYWYDEPHYQDLQCLRESIIECVPSASPYRRFFLCALSNILKPTSRWLTKSIKPQIDPKKDPVAVDKAFKRQFQFMQKANKATVLKSSTINIQTANVLSLKSTRTKVDLIVTSPPYVTSYEYADLHQLSALWLGFVEDYRVLRKGTIGSIHHSPEKKYCIQLNKTGKRISDAVLEKEPSKAHAVARYYTDMQLVIKKCSSFLKKTGLAVFVIGDTEYKGVRIENARHLCETLQDNGFKVRITKRKISGKNLTPYRNKFGKFTTDDKSRKVYAEEFIVIGSRT